MDLVEVLPEQLHMFRFPVGQAYLWRDGAELTLIDAGNATSAPEIEAAVRSLGLRPRNIRRIVLTHCHRDHVGAAEELALRHGSEVMGRRLVPAAGGTHPLHRLLRTRRSADPGRRGRPVRLRPWLSRRGLRPRG